MRWCLFLLATGLVGCGLGGSEPVPDPGPPPVEWSADMQAIADANNRFALALYGKLRDSEKGNIFFSPYSVHTALGMTEPGARGATREQMVSVLHLPADEQKRLASGDICRYYSHPRAGVSLAVANAVWGQKGFPWRPEFLAIQHDRFAASFHEADFASNPDTERQRINKWVEEQTKEKIKDLLKPPHIDSMTRMVLANAIHFKGTWTTQFKPEKTRDAPFHLADGPRVVVPLMNTKAKCRWGYLDERQGGMILDLPYSGGEMSMVVLLPKLPDGLPEIERQLSSDSLAKWLGGMRPGEVSVSMPKFRFERDYDLPVHLKALGMVDAFNPVRADFSGMADSSLSIGAVAHKAFIEVNEEGTEAAAATAVVTRAFGFPPSFYIDHPFLLLIRDTKHGTILFMGRVMNPKE
jgi:serpin B